MSKDTVAMKTYTSWLLPNERKHKLLAETFNVLENGAEQFHEFTLALSGIAEFSTIEKFCDAKHDAELTFAISMFKLVEKNRIGSFGISDEALMPTFEKYLGLKTSSEAVRFYLEGNYNEELYAWIDCRQVALAFCKKAGVDPKDFMSDVDILVGLGAAPIASSKLQEVTSLLSSYFGDGNKADRSVKQTLLIQFGEYLNQNNEFSSVKEVQKALFDMIGATDSEDFYKKYASKIGRGCTLVTLARRTDDKAIEPNEVQRLRDHVTKKIALQSIAYNFSANIKIKEYLTKATGLIYKTNIWSQLLTQGRTCVVGKDTRNYNFALEQLETHRKILSDPDMAVKVNILNGFFETNLHPANAPRFAIGTKHIGKSAAVVSTLYKMWGKSTDQAHIDECIVQYIAMLREDSKASPIFNLLRYLWTIRDTLGSKEVYETARINDLIERFEGHKVHPVVVAPYEFVWGGSGGFNGAVIPPGRKLRENDTGIWVEMDMLDNNKWIRHHTKFVNTRMLEEIYAGHSDESNVYQMRSPRDGFKIDKTLTPEQVEFLRTRKKEYRKSCKRQLRVQNSFANKTLMPIKWSKDSVIIVSRKENSFQVKFVYKLKYQGNGKNNRKKALDVGDRFLAFDYNLKAASTYAIFEIVDPNTQNDPNVRFYINHHVRVIETGKIVSTTVTQNREFDQLNYEGISFEEFFPWYQSAYSFVAQHREGSATNRNGDQISVNYLAELERIASYNPHLYSFNREYASLLKKMMRGQGKLSTELLQEYRKEILFFLTGQFSVLRLSSLSMTSFEAIRQCKSLINAYYSHRLGSIYTDEDRKNCDPEMFDFLNQLETKRKKKMDQRIKRIASAIITKSIAHQCCFFVMEGDLAKASSGGSRASNASMMDWCSRGVYEKCKQLVNMHPNLSLMSIEPYMTSHQDPFEHKKDGRTSVMRARMNVVDIDSISARNMKDFSRFLQTTNRLGTTYSYYAEAMRSSLNNYGLQHYEKDILHGKMSPEEFRDAIKAYMPGVDKILVPRKFGRYYLSTHKVTSSATRILFDNKTLWLSDSDEVAAVNIGLRRFN